MLADELGLDPGVELQELEAAILAQDPALAPAGAGRRRSHRRRAAGSARSLSRFVGRAAEIAELGALVDDHRLVTVVGPGGAGKTRLAIEVAGLRPADEPVVARRARAGGRRRAASPARSPTRVGAADGIARRRAPARRADRPPGPVHRRPRRRSLVLDNCEHVIDEAARVAEALLVACPSCGSWRRAARPLAIGGETVWPIPAMAIDDAVELFADRAGGDERLRARRRRPRSSSSEVCTASTGCRSRSSSRRAGSGRSRSASSRPGSTTGSGCSPAAPAPRSPASRRCGPSSSGATTCSSTTSGACSSACRSSPAVARSRRPKRCARATTSRPRTSPTCSPTSSTSRW